MAAENPEIYGNIPILF